MFSSFVIVVHESLNCPQCEIIESLLERVQTCRRCCETKEVQERGGFFSEEQQDQRGTHDQLSLNIKQSWIMTHSIKTQGYVNF